MAEYNTSFPKKKKKKWTKKRIRRYARAWFFRILFVLILLLALFLVVSGVKAMARGISHLFSGGGSDPKVTAAADSTDSADEMTGAVTEEASAEGEEAVSEAATEAPTEAPTEAYDPVIQKLTLTAAGNCTLGTTQSQ